MSSTLWSSWKSSDAAVVNLDDVLKPVGFSQGLDDRGHVGGLDGMDFFGPCPGCKEGEDPGTGAHIDDLHPWPDQLFESVLVGLGADCVLNHQAMNARVCVTLKILVGLRHRPQNAREEAPCKGQ